MYTRHQLSSLFGNMSTPEFAELQADIQENGIQDPVITLHEEQVLDGWHRYQACITLGIIDDLTFVNIEQDPITYVLSQNLHRRHLTASQRAQIVVEANAWATPKDNQFTLTAQNCTVKTKIEMAEQANVSPRSIDNAKQVSRAGRSEEVIAGEKSASAVITEEKEKDAAIFKADADAFQPTNSFKGRSTGNPEWYTPADFIERVRTLFGEIDLDPASCDIAQETVKALTYYTEADDGLSKAWSGKVFLNPPYAVKIIRPFINKLIESLGEVTEAILLVSNNTETDWFQKCLHHCSAFCFPSFRLKFYNPDGTTKDIQNGQTVFYFGENPNPFISSFSELGATYANHTTDNS